MKIKIRMKLMRTKLGNLFNLDRKSQEIILLSRQGLPIPDLFRSL